MGEGRYLLTSVSRSFTGSCTFASFESICVKRDNSSIALKINESHYVKLCLCGILVALCEIVLLRHLSSTM